MLNMKQKSIKRITM